MKYRTKAGVGCRSEKYESLLDNGYLFTFCVKLGKNEQLP